MELRGRGDVSRVRGTLTLDVAAVELVEGRVEISESVQHRHRAAARGIDLRQRQVFALEATAESIEPRLPEPEQRERGPSRCQQLEAPHHRGVVEGKTYRVQRRIGRNLELVEWS